MLKPVKRTNPPGKIEKKIETISNRGNISRKHFFILPYFLTITLLFLGTPQKISAAGAWPRKVNSGYAQLSYVHLASDIFFINDAKEKRQDYSRDELDLYAEYGVAKNLTAVLSGPVFISHSLPNADGSGIGDANLELHYAKKICGIFLGSGLGFVIPSGESDRSDSLSTGAGSWDGLVKLFMAKPFWKGRMAVDAELGYRLRAEYVDVYTAGLNLSGKLPYGFRLGYGIHLQQAIGSIDESKVNPYLGNSEGVEYFTDGIYLGYVFKRVSASFTMNPLIRAKGNNLIADSYQVFALGYSF